MEADAAGCDVAAGAARATLRLGAADAGGSASSAFSDTGSVRAITTGYAGGLESAFTLVEPVDVGGAPLLALGAFTIEGADADG